MSKEEKAVRRKISALEIEYTTFVAKISKTRKVKRWELSWENFDKLQKFSKKFQELHTELWRTRYSSPVKVNPGETFILKIGGEETIFRDKGYGGCLFGKECYVSNKKKIFTKSEWKEIREGPTRQW